MTVLSFLPLVLKHLLRQPLRTLLTVWGVAVAVFIFSAVEAMRRGVERATQVTAQDTTLVVYREHRYCHGRKMVATLGSSVLICTQVYSSKPAFPGT